MDRRHFFQDSALVTTCALAGYALGLDMARRDLQRFTGDQKKPWGIGWSIDKSVAEQISKLPEAFEPYPGDIIYSGTPRECGSGGARQRDRNAHRRPAQSEQKIRLTSCA